MVPSTVIREIDGAVGSLQSFVEKSIIPSRMPVSDFNNHIKEHGDQYLKMFLFDILIANSDRHSGNMLIDENGNIRAIDHGFSFEPDTFMFSVESYYGEYISETVKEELLPAFFDESRLSILKDLLLELLEKKAVNSFFKRLNLVKKYLEKGNISEYAYRELFPEYYR